MPAKSVMVMLSSLVPTGVPVPTVINWAWVVVELTVPSPNISTRMGSTLAMGTRVVESAVVGGDT